MNQVSPQINFFKQSISLISGLSLLSSGLLGIQHLAGANTNELVIPETSQPSTAPVVEPLKPVPIQPLQPLPQTTPIKSPVVNTYIPVKAPIPKQQINIDTSTRLTLPQNHPTNMPVLAPQDTPAGKNNYIDTTNYNTSPSSPYTPPSSVVITERSTGCQTIAQNGQLIRGQCAVTTQAKTPQTTVKPRSPVNLIATNLSQTYQPKQPVIVTTRPVNSNTVVYLKPPQINGVQLSLAPVPPDNTKRNDKYERATRLNSNLANQPRRTDLLFPLVIPAQISSVFGWRIHPITGSHSMHAGTDLAAPMGTPVLAAYEGEVAVADWADGYGLMVILRHLKGTQESRYAHLSEIYVKPSEWVEQGTVIGRVGSTGLSTGPHLHFEWRHNTEQGWVAVDAGLHLEYALDNLVQSLELAKITPENEE